MHSRKGVTIEGGPTPKTKPDQVIAFLWLSSKIDAEVSTSDPTVERRLGSEEPENRGRSSGRAANPHPSVYWVGPGQALEQAIRRVL